jgi:glycerol-3-phosphate acyltransferase PlsY
MVVWIGFAAGILIAYLLGSIPTGHLAGKLRGIDIREHGSKSTGATNVLRKLGKLPALAVLIVDVLKGSAAIVFAGWYYSWLSTNLSHLPSAEAGLHNFVPWAVCLSGLAVLVGHGRSVWLNFAGGKSAATGLGVLLAISLPVGIGAALIWGLLLAILRIVSLGSILAALSAIVIVLALDHPLPYRLLVVLGGLYVVIRHRANIQRLLAGTEPRLGSNRPSK